MSDAGTQQGAPTGQTAAEAALLAAYVTASARLRAHVLAILTRSWRQLGTWRDPQVDRWLEQTVKVVTAAEHRASLLTHRYLAGQLGEIPAVKLDPTALRGVSPAEVYRRPADQLWTDLANGKTIDQAVASSTSRIEQIATTDLQLAQTHTAQAVFVGDQRVVGYRRVLTGAETCELCTLASTRLYHKAQLLPIHPRCDCKVAPVLMGAPDASVSPDSGPVRGVAVHDHGEIGPVLYAPHEHFEGEEDHGTEKAG